ncbi:DNA invertase Pin-like site-specific DNA recombinase [Hydrogenoanaerobacterium saccharovorans]|uniref:Site-specific DNA recombinase n=1 Tax=Hydrogenoanaerobacterium saccharovorans TaxID=474960 RepID=A0A1H7YG71_9FIRM|nr:recombinase family protein [Hydrogenoanaerobacterium saccharovorans]RPF41887.1 DNA invertase Pin-like site-specific DNA recombinase [Hydrogenoanaerobacterium saccharovorans]SEM45222.1 Site-specific DNA recombinase [Hydrogenoanaerobacterium saccharovorans]
MKAVMYLRKSRMEELSNEEETLERHKKSLTEFAKTNKISIIKIYEEVVSGDTLYSRPQMLQLLADVEANKYDAVLCMDIDRLGRSSMSDQGVILETLKQNDTKIITPRKFYDLNNDIDETYSEFESFMARQELKIIKRRLHTGIKRTIKDGGYIANAPYGYDKIYKDKIPTLAINEDEAVFVRMIFDMYVNQGIGSLTIAETLNSLGARPRRSDKFGRTSIVAILKNQVYIGKIVWDKKKHIKKGTKNNTKHITIYNKPEQWTVVDGLHEPIIDKELFESAQEILKNRYHPPYYKGTVENPLAGLVKCGNCGRTMQRQYMHRGERGEWETILCMNKGCIPSAKLAYVEESILHFLYDEMNNIAVELKTEQRPKKDITLLEAALDATEKEISTAKQQRSRLHDLLEQGVYDIPTFTERSKALEEKLATLQEQATAQHDAIKKAQGTNKLKMYKKIKSVLQAYETADAQKRNMMLKSIIREIVYKKEQKSKPHDFALSISFKDL